MMFRRLLLAAAVTATIAPAQAQDLFGTPGAEMWQWNGFYIGAGAQYQAFGLAPHSNVRHFTGGGPVVEPRVPFVHSFGPQGVLGYAFAPGALPAWLGQNVRVQIDGRYLMGETNASKRAGFVGPVTDITVTGLVTGAGNVTTQIESDLRVRLWHYRFGFKAASDFALGENFLLTPSLGFVGGRTQTGYRLNTLQTTGTFNYFQDSRIDWTDIGGRIGLAGSYRATPWLAVELGGYVELLHRRASFSTTDCFQSVGGSSCLFGTGVGVSAGLTRFATPFGGEATIRFSAGGSWVLSLTGSVELDPSVPSYRDQAVGVPAGLKTTSQVNYSGMARFALRLN